MGDEVLACRSPTPYGTGASNEGGCMPDIKANQAVLVGRASAFKILFITLVAVTEPMTAFVLALIATLVLSANY